MNRINEAEIRNTWSPIIEEATGITDSNKLAWMSEYCHNHKLYEDANIMSLNNNPGPMNLTGMGAVSFPTPGNALAGAAAGTTGSGDKAPTLLPLAMQVAAQTIGLDLVPVVPMAGPMGLLSYLDFTYGGGTLEHPDGTTTISKNGHAPTLIKSPATDGNGDADEYTFTKAVDADGNVLTSRLDGETIYVVTETTTAHSDTLTAAFQSLATGTPAVSLISALEDHVPNFSGQLSGSNAGKPYSRNEGEYTADRLMGLSLFSKSVTAETFQVAAAVTREQVQDLKQFGVDAVAQVEAVLTNELTQSINAHILYEMRAIAEEGVAAITLDSGTSGGNTRGDEHRRLLTNILAAANLIANRGRRGAGNFAVVDAKVASALQGVAGFVPNPMANTFNQVAGAIYPVGSVAGINVYTDPLMPFNGTLTDHDASAGSAAVETHQILVGRKGDGNGPGLVFMPYLMAESVQTIAEGTMAPKVAVKSRYALVAAGFHPETQYQKFNVYGLEL
jgi:hypothetical protein